MPSPAPGCLYPTGVQGVGDALLGGDTGGLYLGYHRPDVGGEAICLGLLSGHAAQTLSMLESLSETSDLR